MKSVSHIAVHYPVPEWTGLITSIAYPYSPAEIPRGPSYRFNMNHVVEPDSPLEMFRIEYEKVAELTCEAVGAHELIRSKNSGPFELTFDVIFKDREGYEKVRDAKLISAIGSRRPIA